MSEIIHTQGIVLRKLDYSEYNSLYSIYTKELGKILAVCRGSKKINSKLAGNLESFAVCEFVFVKGKTFFQIIGNTIYKNYKTNLLDLKKIIYSLFCLELTDSLIKEQNKDEKVFYLLDNVLSLIDSTFAKQNFYIYSYAFRLFCDLGFSPELFVCIRCKERIKKDKNKFCVFEGGLQCDKCGNNVKHNSISVSQDCIKILRLISISDIMILTKIIISDKVFFEFKAVVDEMIRFYLGKNLKTSCFFK